IDKRRHLKPSLSQCVLIIIFILNSSNRLLKRLTSFIPFSLFTGRHLNDTLFIKWIFLCVHWFISFSHFFHFFVTRHSIFTCFSVPPIHYTLFIFVLNFVKGAFNFQRCTVFHFFQNIFFTSAII